MGQKNILNGPDKFLEKIQPKVLELYDAFIDWKGKVQIVINSQNL